MADDKRNKLKSGGSDIGSRLIPLASLGPQPAETRTDLVSVILFETGGERFAVDVDSTEGVVDCPRVSPLPGAPEGVVGATSVRGRITVVIDPSSGQCRRTTRRRLVLMKGEAQAGLLAEHVERVLAVEPENITPIDDTLEQPKRVKSLARNCLSIDGSHVPIIDVEKLAEL